MIGIVDYGVGNLFSLYSSLKYLGIDCAVSADKQELKRADGIILPGVGAFADAYSKLEQSGLVDFIKGEAHVGKPLLGICLGMQLLLDESFEYGRHKGLGLIRGSVVPIRNELKEAVKVPHMGWNSLNIKNGGGLLKYNTNGEFVYYVHSYYAQADEDSTTSTSSYGGVTITGSVARGNVYGTQFHPEKSGAVGLKMLKAYAELCKRR